MSRWLTQFYCVPVTPEGTKSVKINTQVDYPYSFNLNSEAYQFCKQAGGEALAFMRTMDPPKLYLLFNPRTCETCIPTEYPLEERSEIQENFIAFLLERGNWGKQTVGQNPICCFQCNYILKAERADREICRLLSLSNKFKKYTKFLLTRTCESVKINVVNRKCGCGGTGRRAGLRNQCQRRGGSSPLIRTINLKILDIL